MSRVLMNKLLVAYRRNVFMESLHCGKCGNQMMDMPKKALDDSFYLTNQDLWLELSKDRQRAACHSCLVIDAKAHHHRRRSQIAASETHFSRADVVSKFDSQGGLCVYCGVDLMVSKYHIDHINPLIRGGSNRPDNIQLLCPTCNVSKGKKTHEEYLQYRLTTKKPNVKNSITCSSCV